MVGIARPKPWLVVIWGKERCAKTDVTPSSKKTFSKTVESHTLKHIVCTYKWLFLHRVTNFYVNISKFLFMSRICHFLVSDMGRRGGGSKQNMTNCDMEERGQKWRLLRHTFSWFTGNMCIGATISLYVNANFLAVIRQNDSTIKSVS